MKTHIVDANAILSFVTDRNEDHQRKAARIFYCAAQLQTTVLCPQHVISECVYVLENIYALPQKRIATLIKDFILMPGILIIDDLDMSAVLSFWPDTFSDFGDAVVASVAQQNKHGSVVTFDKNFIQKLTSIGIEVNQWSENGET